MHTERANAQRLARCSKRQRDGTKKKGKTKRGSSLLFLSLFSLRRLPLRLPLAGVFTPALRARGQILMRCERLQGAKSRAEVRKQLSHSSPSPFALTCRGGERRRDWTPKQRQQTKKPVRRRPRRRAAASRRRPGGRTPSSGWRRRPRTDAERKRASF